MKNRSFVRLWAPLIAALVFAVAFLATHFTLNPAEKAKAVNELNALMDMAEARAAEGAGEEQDKAADSAVIHKARTLERFLAHDDTLLQTDALAVLCELTDVQRVAVLDGEGGVIAASDGTLIGQSYAEDKAMAWCMALYEDGAQSAAEKNGTEGRMAGVPRSDIDGVVLIWSGDTASAGAGGIRGAVNNLAVEPDKLKLVETTGENGVFEQDDMLYVQRAEGDVTLIAYRPLSEVFAVQNAVLTSLAVFAAICIILLFIWQLIPRGNGGEPMEQEPQETRDEPLLLPEPGEGTEETTRHRKKRRRPMIELVQEEPEEVPAPEPVPDAWTLSDEPAPRPRKKGPRTAGRSRKKTEEQRPDDDGFDKIFE